MEFIELGKTGEKIPVLGIGTWKIEANPQEAIEALQLGFKEGMKLIDTAEIYNNEELIGKALKGQEGIFVATKVYPTHFHYDDVIKSCNASLEKLGIKTIDLYQLHRPKVSEVKIPIEETMGAMEELVRQGKIRYIGVSNFSVQELKEAQGVMKENRIVSNQIEYSILVRDAEREMLEFCKNEGITVIAYRPLVRGDILSGRHPKTYRFLTEIGKKYGKTPVQVALNWVISKGNICVIPKTSSKAHAIENAGASDFKLSPEDMKKLDESINKVQWSPRENLSEMLQSIPIVKRKFSNMTTLYNTFIDQQYEWLCNDLRPLTTAIDIGANIGTTSIYLAMRKEIQKILAYEPYPYLYNQALSNILRSGFTDKITLFNCGIGLKSSVVHIPENHAAGIDSPLKDFGKGKKIDIVALNQILKGLHNVVIKCDAEGIEHSIFSEETDLSNVYRIQIEYHNGIQGLDKLLEMKGFGVKTKKTAIEKKVGEYGFIYARKW